MQVRYFSNIFLNDTIKRATADERMALARLFPSLDPITARPEMIMQSVSHAGEHAATKFLFNGKGVSYAEILSDIASHLKVPGHVGIYSVTAHGVPCFAAIDRIHSPEGKRYTVNQKLDMVEAYLDQLEKSILSFLLQQIYENATAEVRIAIDSKVTQIVTKSDDYAMKGITGGAALLGLANASGFALYTTASTILSTISAGTLGFGAYTATSSLISFLIGPAGWLALGAYGVFKVGGPNKRLLLQVVVSCSLIAQRERKSKMAAT